MLMRSAPPSCAGGKQGVKKADGLGSARQRCEDGPRDRALAEARTRTVTGTARNCRPRPGQHSAFAADGKVVVSFKNAGKFGQRYSTLEFQDSANLDDGDLWPVSYALKKWTPTVEKKIVELVKAAIS
jgi:hypothetical protein